MSAAEIRQADDVQVEIRAELAWRRALADAARRRYQEGQAGHSALCEAEAALAAALDLWRELQEGDAA